jgi:hypothetical protein
MKVAPHIVERLLNHKLGSIGNKTDGMVSAVGEVYNRAAYSTETREAVGLWEKYLARLPALITTALACRGDGDPRFRPVPMHPGAR